MKKLRALLRKMLKLCLKFPFNYLPLFSFKLRILPPKYLPKNLKNKIKAKRYSNPTRAAFVLPLHVVQKWCFYPRILQVLSIFSSFSFPVLRNSGATSNVIVLSYPVLHKACRIGSKAIVPPPRGR